MDFTWIESLPQSGVLLALALLACAESLAVIGIVVPGVALLTLLAALASEQSIPLIWVLLAGFIGAVVGDGLSYGLGYWFRDRIHQWPGFRTHPQWLTQSTAFIHKYGAVSVVMGRFIGPIRPFIPVAAGLFRMPPQHFYLLNILSAAVWSPLYLLPGFLTGKVLDFTNPWVWGGMIIATLIAITCSVILGRSQSQ